MRFRRSWFKKGSYQTVVNENLFYAIKRAGLTLSEFAERLHVTYTTAHSWTFVGRVPVWPAQAYIAHMLEDSIENLFNIDKIEERRQMLTLRVRAVSLLKYYRDLKVKSA